jgi:hypothetical protein
MVAFVILFAVASAVAYLGANYRNYVFTPEDPLAAKIVIPSNLASLEFLHGLLLSFIAGR